MATVEGPEPGLLQVRVGKADPWRVLVLCALLNRTTWVVAEPIAVELFMRWPTADDLADADYGELLELIRPLGFYNQRANRLQAMSAAWVLYEEGQIERLTDIPGVGKYALEAFRLLCLRDISFEPTDEKLLRWRNWYAGIR